MEKGLYNFKILPEIQSFFPAPSQEAQNRLCDSLIENGCTIPIFVWRRNDGNVIVDGHYRYKICHELGIPFDYEELEFEDIEHVKVWLLDVHISTKQLTDFQKCELAFPLEKTISEMVEKRRREAIRKARQTGLQISQSTRTADYMAQRLGLTRSKWDMAKFLINNADEDLKVLLRSGKAKITPTYRRLVALIKPKCVAEEVSADTGKCDRTINGSGKSSQADSENIVKYGRDKFNNKSDDWLPRACSTDGEKAEEPPIEYIGGFKPVTALKFYGTQMRWREEDEEPGDKVKIYEAYKAWCQEAPKDRVLQRPEWFFNTIIHHMKDNFFQDIETEDKRGLREFTLINQAVLTASTAATTTTSAKTA